MAKRTIAGARTIITGASQGIGKAFAELAAARGAKVLAVARSLPLLQEMADKAKEQGHILEVAQVDMTSSEDRQRMLDTVVEKFGGLDLLVNNAGIGATGAFVSADEERLRKIFEVNFFAVTETIRQAIPILENGVNPAIVNISSIAARRGIPSRTEYSASKFAIQGFSEALRAEMVEHDIDVILVNPGLTQTNFADNMLERKARVQLDHHRGMTAEEVAAAIIKAAERGTREVTLTGKGKLLVWMSRFFPGMVDRIIRRRVRKLFRDSIEARRKARAEQQTQST